MNLKKGQFYQDTVNHDLLKILGFTEEHYPENVGGLAGAPIVVLYVRCACISNGNFFGVQEMKLSTLTQTRIEETGAFRFERLTWLQELWNSWKWRNSKLKTPPKSGGSGPVNFEQLAQKY